MFPDFTLRSSSRVDIADVFGDVLDQQLVVALYTDGFLQVVFRDLRLLPLSETVGDAFAVCCKHDEKVGLHEIGSKGRKQIVRNVPERNVQYEFLERHGTVKKPIDENEVTLGTTDLLHFLHVMSSPEERLRVRSDVVVRVVFRVECVDEFARGITLADSSDVEASVFELRLSEVQLCRLSHTKRTLERHDNGSVEIIHVFVVASAILSATLRLSLLYQLGIPFSRHSIRVLKFETFDEVVELPFLLFGQFTLHLYLYEVP